MLTLIETGTVGVGADDADEVRVPVRRQFSLRPLVDGERSLDGVVRHWFPAELRPGDLVENLADDEWLGFRGADPRPVTTDAPAGSSVAAVLEAPGGLRCVHSLPAGGAVEQSGEQLLPPRTSPRRLLRRKPRLLVHERRVRLDVDSVAGTGLAPVDTVADDRRQPADRPLRRHRLRLVQPVAQRSPRLSSAAPREQLGY